jgi:hypothetical protein
MSDGATYAFLSVLRRGLAALIQPGTPPLEPRITVPVSLSVNNSPVTAPPLALRGPGDVVGFDSNAVRRTWPAPGASNAEPNYFALLELSDADLPWRYTPEPTEGDRLTPWLCLIVAEDGEIGGPIAPAVGRPLAAVTVTSAGALPDLAQSWAWAHAQILGGPDAPATDFDANSIGRLLAQVPSRTLARLLCPRQLHPQTSYQAFLVPTYERGRLAGLGEATSGADRMAPAWQRGHEPVTLPVYFSWSFRTGEAGDFASLAAKLQPVADLPAAVWRRDLAVSPPGADPPAWQVVDLESALIPLGASFPQWNAVDVNGFTAALEARTNTAGAHLEPPLYGRWLAASAVLSSSPGATPAWFHQLNADPRRRVAAGLGTMLVQAEQQQLLAGAWAQVAGIRAANEELRLSQLARELAIRLYTRHISAVGSQTLLELTTPLHNRVRTGTSTVGAALAASRIADGALAPVWRRVSRPLGSLGARQGRPSSSPPTALAQGALARMNSGALSIVPTPAPGATKATGAAARLGDLGAVLAGAKVTPEKLHSVSLPPGFVLKRLPPIAIAVHVVGSAAPGDVAPVTPTAAPPELPVDPQPATAAAGFAQAARALMAQLAQPAAAGTIWVQADLGGACDAIKSTLDPRATIEAPLMKRLTGVSAGPRRTDPLEPVMAAPNFPQPMYQPLTGLAQEWLLPGLDKMAADAVALFMTNWPFVESFITGLNHEMARKLLWNGYPTDQRGTYFHHFWDIRSRLDGSTDGDFGPIHRWAAPLGQNHLISGDPLVLLVRGELIRRYPHVVVYAAQAVKNAAGRQPGPAEKQPLFFGRVDPDIALFGFDLDPIAARSDPGWFFVLQEHPSEPRFGLAAPTGEFGSRPSSWQALGWDHLAASARELAALGYIDLGAQLPRDPVTADPAGAVWHALGSPPSRAADLAHITLREPKRLAVHGSMLIPSPPAPAPAAGGNR